MLVDLIKDEHHEVKMGVLKGIQDVAVVVGPELFSGSLLMSLANLMKETQWRIRMTVIHLTSSLAKEFGKEFYAKNLESIFMLFLTDTASSVREAGIEKLQSMATEFKADWIVNGYLPKANEIMNREKIGYLYRMAVLNSLSVLNNNYLNDIEFSTNSYKRTSIIIYWTYFIKIFQRSYSKY